MCVGSAQTSLAENDVNEGALNTAIVTAYLLTGSMAAAEESVAEAIRFWDPDCPPDSFLDTVAEAASRHEEVRVDSWELPLELANVMRLPWNARRCFVLRILLSVPKRRCARMLHLSEESVDRNTCDALQGLLRAAPVVC